MRISKSLVVLTLCILSAGCTVFAPQPDNSQFFILSPISDRPSSSLAPASTGTHDLVLGIGPIDLPDYLRRRQVVTRASSNQVDLSQENRWAEPLDRNFARVLSENLSELLNTDRIEKYPWPSQTRIDYQVMIDVLQFENSHDGKSTLVARWIIKDGGTGKYLYAARSIANEPVGGGAGASSAALSRNLEVLSKDIALKISQLSENGKRSTHSRVDVTPTTSLDVFLVPASL
jgi:uncharacterized lipoprotein YmbA